MKILELKYTQRRNGSEVSTIFDDGSVIALDAEVAVRFRLSRGLVISPELLDKIQHADALIKARRRLIKYVTVRKKSLLEAQRYLKKHGYSDEITHTTVQNVAELGYLNDVEYAEAFARTRNKSGTKGPRIIVAELQARGISRDEAQRVVAPMIEQSTQMSTARKLAAKKFQTLKDEPDHAKASRKLMQHLARRGFDQEICDSVSREFFGDPTIF